MLKSIIFAAGFAAVATAFTQPKSQTYGALLTPSLDSPVTTGQDYTVTWTPNQPADGVTVSLVLCNGPGSNCALQNTAIAENIPAGSGKFKWSVPCSLPAGVAQTSTGYGMLIIVDGTGEFQYSTQFSVNAGSSCSSSSSSASSSASASSSSASGKPVSSPSSSGYYSWTSTLNTTTPMYTATSKYTLSSSAAATTTPVYTRPSSSVAATTTTAKPSSFSGAAVAPSAFVNVAGFLGAAGLAVLAL